jgi:hypothetical protein
MIDPVVRYERHVDRSGDGCHPWTGSEKTNGGYGRFWVYTERWDDGRYVMAHRFGWEQLHGPIPSGMKVCHSCDNPPCQNSGHWFLGTQAENVADCQAKGRRAIPRGVLNGRSKLTDAEVDEARSTYTAERGQQAALARRFGIGRAQMNKILNGKSRVEVSP